MNYRSAQIVLDMVRRCDEEGKLSEADFLTSVLTRALTRTAQADESLVDKIGNAISNGSYALQNWGANAFLGGGQNAQRVVDQIDYFVNQMHSNAFLRDPNQKNALLLALQEARQIAFSLTSGYFDQQQQVQQKKEADLAAQYLTPKASTSQGNVRTADNRSIPVVINDIENLVNFARQAYGNRDQQQVAQLITALRKAVMIMRGTAGYYTPTTSSYPATNTPTNQVAVLDPTHLNAPQKQFLDKYMQIGIARGRDAMLNQMNANPYHTEPFKQMVIQFWDQQVAPKVALRKQMMQGAPKAA